MKILVTGANRGIGLAICASLLSQYSQTFVLLGSRDAERGHKAVEEIVGRFPDAKGRIEMLHIDTASDESVKNAAKTVEEKFGRPCLRGIINNAGVYAAPGSELMETLEVNTRGPARVVDAFLPLLDPQEGRIVNVASAAGPMFLEKLDPSEQQPFLDPDVTWDNICQMMDKYASGDKLGNDAQYGLSKALLNSYTRYLSKKHPALKINACTPGFIETGMTQALAQRAGKTPKEMGMKTVEDGAKVPVQLMMDADVGTGSYFGSDGLRSPWNKYRNPGDPPYTGP